MTYIHVKSDMKYFTLWEGMMMILSDKSGAIGVAELSNRNGYS